MHGFQMAIIGTAKSDFEDHITETSPYSFGNVRNYHYI